MRDGVGFFIFDDGAAAAGAGDAGIRRRHGVGAFLKAIGVKNHTGGGVFSFFKLTRQGAVMAGF